MKPILLVIAQIGYQDLELQGTRDALMAAGFSVRLASKEAGACTGKFGGTEEATVAMREADVSSFAGVAFIGGPGMAAYADDVEVHALAKRTVAAGMLLGAICIAPLAMARAGLLTGSRATAWNEDGKQSAEFAVRGVTYTGEAVTVDGSIITANGPQAAAEFGQALAAALKYE